MDFLRKVIHALTVTHPIHPMLVHFPIALSGAAALFILLAWWKKDKGLEKIAFANLVLTVFGTIAAGATGIYDNQLNYGGDAPNATVKIILASTLLLITTVTVIIRWKNPAVFESKGKALYILAYVVSFLLAFVLAFLGGVILYGF